MGSRQWPCKKQKGKVGDRDGANTDTTRDPGWIMGSVCTCAHVNQSVSQVRGCSGGKTSFVR